MTLRPCAFCGCDRLEYEWGVTTDAPPHVFVHVRCTCCNAQGPRCPAPKFGYVPEAAELAWNNRPATDVPRGTSPQAQPDDAYSWRGPQR